MPEAAARSLRFQGTFLPADSATYVTYPFDVAEACTSIRLRMVCHPYRVGELRNLITLGVFDPKGFRGQAHRGPPDDEVIVSAEVATRGFIAGPLPAGRWQAQIGVHAVLPSPEPCRYSLEIEVVAGDTSGDRHHGEAAAFHAPAQPATNTQPGWYRGELHAHTIHSDGGLSVDSLLARARQRGLDFVAISDHNTVSAWGDLMGSATRSPLVIPATELTTFRGHAVALGVDRWIDWRTGYEGWTINDAARATHAAGGLFIVAHPSRIGGPLCAGCHWEYDELDAALADGMEIWSGPWTRDWDDNPSNLRLWRDLLASPHPRVGVAGADVHIAKDWGPAVPVTYVYAEELSVAAIVQGIRRGRVVLTTGPWLELSQTKKHGVLLETAVATGQMHSNVLASWKDAPTGARLCWLSGNSKVGEIAVGEQGRAGLFSPPGPVHLELWSSAGVLLAVTNPIAAT